jgi:hypothetical protein
MHVTMFTPAGQSHKGRAVPLPADAQQGRRAGSGPSGRVDRAVCTRSALVEPAATRECTVIEKLGERDRSGQRSALRSCSHMVRTTQGAARMMGSGAVGEFAGGCGVAVAWLPCPQSCECSGIPLHAEARRRHAPNLEHTWP